MKTELILFDLDDTLMAFDVVSEEAWDRAVDLFIIKNNLNIKKDILNVKTGESMENEINIKQIVKTSNIIQSITVYAEKQAGILWVV